jgi:hypothetical protein
MLCGVTEGVCRPLRSRVEQILVSEASPVLLYRLTNLIRFYEATISAVLKCEYPETNKLSREHTNPLDYINQPCRKNGKDCNFFYDVTYVSDVSLILTH